MKKKQNRKRKKKNGNRNRNENENEKTIETYRRTNSEHLNIYRYIYKSKGRKVIVE